MFRTSNLTSLECSPESDTHPRDPVTLSGVPQPPESQTESVTRTNIEHV